MTFSPYFLEYLDFLRDGGRAMADGYPQAADMLSRSSFDPDVERVLEGVAFIASRIGEKQGEVLGEVCQLMLDILFPHYLCPIPAMAVVELAARRPTTVERGTTVLSVPVLGTRCRFRTAYEVETTGLQIDEVRWRREGRSAMLEMQFGRPDGAVGEPAPLPERPLRLYLHGEPLITRSLFEALLTQLEQVELVDARGRGLGTLDLDVSAVGYAPQEALLDYPHGSFDGFRLLQEYFAFPAKFMFVELRGLWEQLRRRGLARPERFSLRLTLGGSGEVLTVTRQNIRVDCTPVVNLFEHTADPIRRDLTRSEYRVRPAGPHLHHEIYRVLGITAIGPGGHRQEYPLLSEVDDASSSPFAQLIRRYFDGDAHYYVALGQPHGLPAREETLITDLLCTNGQLSRPLGAGDLAAFEDRDIEASCRNITALTRPLAPPTADEVRRRLVMHLALSQRELTELQALRDSLDLYNYPAIHQRQAARAHQLLLGALLEVHHSDVQHMYRNVPIWGAAVDLAVDEASFDTPAEVHLLGCVLNEYVALQAPVNTFTEFALRRARSRGVHRWPRRIGPQTLQSFSNS